MYRCRSVGWSLQIDCLAFVGEFAWWSAWTVLQILPPPLAYCLLWVLVVNIVTVQSQALSINAPAPSIGTGVIQQWVCDPCSSIIFGFHRARVLVFCIIELLFKSRNCSKSKNYRQKLSLFCYKNSNLWISLLSFSEDLENGLCLPKH